MSHHKRTARLLAHAEETFRDRMWGETFSQSAEDYGIAAWRALDSFTMLSAAELRQERGTLVEMQDMIRRALEASK
jgi:hypothetical protein